jgi:hypothetical protein
MDTPDKAHLKKSALDVSRGIAKPKSSSIA